MRFESNGYAPGLIAMHEYDSLFTTETRDAVFTRLDQRIADLLRTSHADKVDLLGHSLGTGLMQQYLNSSAQRAATVAHYVNLDGSPASAPPGGVPTLAVWGSGSPSRKITGATNIYFTQQSHVQVVSSPETFEQIYSFFTGKEPATTKIEADGGDRFKLAGRAQLFPQNTGITNGTLQIFEVNGATGQRLDDTPEATFPLQGNGDWGPFTARAGTNYEFAVARPGAPTTQHIYFEPFVRPDSWIRLLLSPPTGGIGDLVQRSPNSSALTIVRYKEQWGDQGANNDVLEVNGVSILTAANSARREARERSVRVRCRNRRRHEPEHADPRDLRSALPHRGRPLHEGGEPAERHDLHREHASPRGRSRARRERPELGLVDGHRDHAAQRLSRYALTFTSARRERRLG